MTKAIIFDFDGVIILGDQSRFAAIQKAAVDNGVKINDSKIKNLIGKTTSNFLHDILPEQKKSLLKKILFEYDKQYNDNIQKFVKPIDFTIEFIKNYQGSLLLAIASLSSRKKVEKIINYYGIASKFVKVVCREDVKHHKPNPEIYLKASLALGVLPGECIAIEDSPVGVKSAINAQMPCFGLLNGFNSEEEFKNVGIEGFVRTKRDLENIVKTI